MKTSDLTVFSAYFQYYFELMKDQDLMDLLDRRCQTSLEFIQSIPNEKFSHRYAANKWSLGQVIQHVIDAELIFLFRALSFARGEKQSLPGWDEIAYGDIIDQKQFVKEELISALEAQMNLTYQYFKSFQIEDLNRIGIANSNAVSVAAIGFAILGHQIHHHSILSKRYLDN